MVITVENERLCPGIVTDKIHLPSPTIPFSIPLIIYVTKGGLGIESSGSDVVPLGKVIDNGGTRSEAVEI